MFGNLGFSELLMILVFALIVFGPRRLPEIAKSLGKTLAGFRRAATDLRNTVEREVDTADLRGPIEDLRALGRLTDPLPRTPPAAAPPAAAPPAAAPPAAAPPAAAPPAAAPAGEGTPENPAPSAAADPAAPPPSSES